MGLWLVRSLASQLSERLTVDNSASGTCVTMIFPLLKQPLPAPDAPQAYPRTFKLEGQQRVTRRNSRLLRNVRFHEDCCLRG